MPSTDGSHTVIFVAGVAVGACIAVVVGRYVIAPRRQWSWRSACRLLLCHQEGCYTFPGPAILVSKTDEIISEQFTRNVQFFGDYGQMRIHSALVVVVGLGGVGSHAATMLLRSGVGRLRLIDFDQIGCPWCRKVSLSSLNRHAVADRADVGISKAVCLRNHFERIFPEASVDARVSMFESASEEHHLSGNPSFVLDCIDNIETKVALLAACVRRGIPILSAMGAGVRADPTRIRIADISESAVDPLSRSVRYRLRREHGVESGIPVVFSTEEPKAKLMPFQGQNPIDYQTVPGFRVRVLPVLGTLPAIFGQAMATHVLTQLAGMVVRNEPVLRLHVDHYGLMHRRLVEREEMRWDDSRGPSIANLILLTFDEADAHEASSLVEIQEREPEWHQLVTAVLTEAHYDLYGKWNRSDAT